MPRTPRRWEPDAIHHAVARAHCGQPFFAADEEREFVVRRAMRAFRETGATCLAWAVLSNHYHVLLRCPGPPGPTFARLNTALGRRVSGRRGDRGAVFQNRFYSDPCRDHATLLRRIVYVIGNPIHHRVVPSVDALRVHPWTGLGEVLGLRPARWTDVPALLELISSDPARARTALVEAIEAKAAEWAIDGGDPNEDRGLDELESASHPGAHASTGSGIDPSSPVTARAAFVEPGLTTSLRRQGWTPARLVPIACEYTGAVSGCVATGARARADSDARGIVAHVACDVAGFTLAETAPCVGVDPSALVRAARRGRDCLARLGVNARVVLDRSLTQP